MQWDLWLSGNLYNTSTSDKQLFEAIKAKLVNVLPDGTFRYRMRDGDSEFRNQVNKRNEMWYC
jgi:hypothetical protein